MDAIDDMIFKFAYRMALDDATRQRAYVGADKKGLRECQAARGAIKAYIEGIVGGAAEPDFMATVDCVMNAFEHYPSADGTFTFGNAQKLINMTAKYMFMATYGRPKLRSRFARCDCPMDSVLIRKVVEGACDKGAPDSPDASLNEYLNQCARQITRGINKGKWVPADDFKWSKLELGDERYILFQDAVRTLAASEGLIPIEYDFKEWN